MPNTKVKLFKRSSRRTLLVEVNPFQTLVAIVRHPPRAAPVLEAIGEFPVDDTTGLPAWLDDHFGTQRPPLPVYVSATSGGSLFHRESIAPRRLSEPGYLVEVLRERRKLETPEAWTLLALDPLEGTPMSGDGSPRPGLVVGAAHPGLHALHQHFLDQHLVPQRLELGLLPLFGAVMEHKALSQDKRATVVVVIEQEHTTAYILGKEGVHTPGPVRHGFASIAQAACREFDLQSAEDVRTRLHYADDEVQIRASKFVRSIGRDLKPLVDSYEMTTGQPVGEIYCAYLPAALAWIAQPLAHVIQRSSFAPDCRAWLGALGIETAPELPELGPHWFGLLSLLRPLPATLPAPDDPDIAPWRLDPRPPAIMPRRAWLGRRVATLATTVVAAVLVLAFTAWQWQAKRALDADTAFWSEQIASNKAVFDDLTRIKTALAAKSTRFGHAHQLLSTPYQATDLILELGRSLPPNMRIDRLEANDLRFTMRGALYEPPEQSSRTLGRYLEQLRGNPAIGPLFTSIDLSALQREGDSSEALAFEITFRLKETRP